jgi:hypothetical protein
MVSTLAVVGKLQRLLSSQAIVLLDYVLESLTNPHMTSYGAFWSNFGDRFPEAPREAMKGQTYSILQQLRTIIREYGELK